MRFKVLSVTVPPGAGHFNERRARFNQSPGHDALFGKLGRAVLVADALGFLRYVEQFFTGHQTADALIGRIMAADGIAVASPCETLTKQAAEIVSLFVVEFIDDIETFDIFRHDVLVEEHRGIA